MREECMYCAAAEQCDACHFANHCDEALEDLVREGFQDFLKAWWEYIGEYSD